MRGVFLHVLGKRMFLLSVILTSHFRFILNAGDALGSVVVIISALVIYFTDWEYETYIDPAMSILLVCIISYTTIPLLRESAMILMQTVPTHIEIDDIKNRLLKIQGVHAVHELHIWQLAGDRIIASAHIRCHNLQEYMLVAGKIKQFFHDEGIHSTTMQPEFEEPVLDRGVSTEQINPISNCIIPCPPDQNCSESVCCRPKSNGKILVVTENPPPAYRDLAENARTLEKVLTDGSLDHPVVPSSVPSPKEP
jgi:hypothetical protein